MILFEIKLIYVWYVRPTGGVGAKQLTGHFDLVIWPLDRLCSVEISQKSTAATRTIVYDSSV